MTNQINGTHCKKPKRFGASLRCSLNSRSFTGERNLNFVLIETVNGSDAILQHQKSSVIEMKRVRQARLVDNSVLKGITLNLRVMKITLVQPAGIFYVVKYSFYLVIFAADNNKLLLNPNLFDVCYKNQYPRYKFLEGIIHHKNTKRF